MKRSPYNLIQEIYLEGPISDIKVWKVFICCMLLCRTSREQVDKIRKNLFDSWPSPMSMSTANPEELSKMITSLGFGRKRAEGLIKMSTDYISKPWKNPSDLFGLGKYADDAYQIFVRGKRVKNPSDHFLNAYQEWKYKGVIDYEKLERSKKFMTHQ